VFVVFISFETCLLNIFADACFFKQGKTYIVNKNIVYHTVFTMEKSQNNMNISQKYIRKNTGLIRE
jgi:hypothetical protein